MPDTCLQSDKGSCRAAEIYKEHGTFIRKIISIHVKDEFHGDDIFQDFFLHLVAFPVPDDVQNVENYLFRAIATFINSSGRRATEYQARLKRYASNGKYVHRESSPDEQIMNNEEAEKMFRLISTLLPSNSASALLQRYKEGLDIHEVAKSMDLDVKSVSRYISSGLSKIHRIVTVGEGSNI